MTPASPSASAVGWHLHHTYAGLPDLLHSAVRPTPVRAPEFVVFNAALATELGLDVAALDSPEGAAIFAGNVVPDGAFPLAQAYAGHQFGHFTALGDGRAILLGGRAGGARRSGRCCASWSSARPCTPSAFPRPGLSRSWPRASPCSASVRCPGRC